MPAKRTKKKSTILTKAQKPRKLDQLKQTHGKDTTAKQKVTLAQIWGEKASNLYGTDSAEEYEAEIKSMNKSDLWSHSVEHHIRPMESRERLEKELVKNFRKHVLAFNVPRHNTQRPKNISKRVKDILAEGR